VFGNFRQRRFLAAQRSQALALAAEDAGRRRRAAGCTDPDATDPEATH